MKLKLKYFFLFTFITSSCFAGSVCKLANSNYEACQQITCTVQNTNPGLCEHVPIAERICTPNLNSDDDSFMAGVQYCLDKMGGAASCLGSTSCLSEVSGKLWESYQKGVSHRFSSTLRAVLSGNPWIYFTPESSVSPTELISAFKTISSMLYDGVSGYNCYKRKFAFQHLCNLESAGLYLTVAGGGRVLFTQKDFLGSMELVLKAQRAQQPESTILALLRKKLQTVTEGAKRTYYSTQTSKAFSQAGMTLHEKFNQSIGSLGQLEYRSKTAPSIKSKLNDRDIPILGVDHAKKIVDDGHGLRLTLKDTGPEGVETLVNQIKTMSDNGEVIVLGVRNYHGQNISPYLNPSQFEILKAESLSPEALAAKGIHAEADTLKSSTSQRKTGYTGMAVKLYDPKTKEILELQVRGQSVHEIAEVEHYYYDFITGKRVPAKINQCFKRMGFLQQKEAGGANMSKLERNSANLNYPKMQQDFTKYTEDLYRYARNRELGIPTTVPQVPPSLAQYEQRLREVIPAEMINTPPSRLAPSKETLGPP